MSEMNDSPIIDAFDDARNSSWGFRSVKRRHLDKTLGKPKTTTKEVEEEKARNQSWKDLGIIRKGIQKIEDTFTELSEKRVKKAQRVDSTPNNATGSPSRPKVESTSHPLVDNTTQKRREWYIKLRFQQNLIDRLTKIERSIRGGQSSSLGAMSLLGSLGAIGALLKTLTPLSIGQQVAKGVSKSMIPILLGGGLIGKTVSKAGQVVKDLIKNGGTKAWELAKRGGNAVVGGVRNFGTKAMPYLRNAGAALGRTSVGRTVMAGAEGLARFLVPRISASIAAGPLAPLVGAGLTVKAVWDYLLPKKWKEYIKYKTAKAYLAAIDKISELMGWVANTFDEMKKAVSDYYEGVKAKILGVLDFTKDLITGEGDARSRVKAYFSSMYAHVETVIGGYLKEFALIFKKAYESFIAPFYDEKGNFSLLRGAKYYGGKVVDTAKDVKDDVGNAVKSGFKAIAESPWNPMNWRENAEQTVKEYESKQAAELAATGKDQVASQTLLNKTQEQATQAIKSLTESIDNSAKAAKGAYSNVVSGASNAVSGGGGSQSGYTGGTPSNGGKGVVVGISGSSGVGTGAHLDVRYPSAYAQQNNLVDANGKRKEVSKELLSRLSVGGKPLSSMQQSSGHGPRNIGVGSKYHEGVDYALPVGSEIVSTYPVRSVTKAYDKSGGGYYTTVTFKDGQQVNLLHQDASMQQKLGKVVDSGQGGQVIADTRATRNNNPGNLRYAEWQKRYGATGGDREGGKSGMAVFPSYEQGRAALERMIFESNDGRALDTKGDYGKGLGYKDKTLTQMLAAYAPKEDANDTKAYQEYVLKQVGGQNKRMSEYTPQERAAIINALEVKEGYRKGGSSPAGDVTEQSQESSFTKLMRALRGDTSIDTPMITHKGDLSTAGTVDSTSTLENNGNNAKGSTSTVSKSASVEPPSLDAPIANSAYNDLSAIEVADMIRDKRRVNSMGASPDQDVYNSAPSNSSSGGSTITSPSTTSGSSPTDILTRLNFANTKHENAFPQ